MNRRILVIDDTESIHEDFRKILGPRDSNGGDLGAAENALFGDTTPCATTVATFQVDSALQGQEGYERVQQAGENGTPYAMAFVDMRMPPGWDGVETIEQLWKVDPDLQVVVCTAYADYSWEKIVQRLGRTDQLLLLKKPFESEEVWQLACALTQKWGLTQQARLKLSDLEEMVAKRTAELKSQILERKQAEDSAAQFGRILDSSLVNEVYIVDAENLHFLRVNRGALENLGYSMDELRQMTPVDFIPEHNPRSMADLLSPLRTGEQEQVHTTTVHRRKDGSTYPVEVHIEKSTYSDSSAFVAIVRDVSEQKSAEERLRHVALHDSLTGLPNRTLLVERLERSLIRAKRQSDFLFAVLFLDIDNFKLINDSLGHNAGDEFLVKVADRLKSGLRSLDTIVRLEADTTARLGGDEFVVLLEGISKVSDAARVADRLQEHLRGEFGVSGHSVVVTASIGICVGRGDYDEAHHLLRDADTAMYRAKNAGKARYALFDREMHEKARVRLQIETDLRHAISRAEFRLLFQPIVSLPRGLIIGLEALLRWEHPTLGLLLPDRFISIAEESGLIVPIGRWVIGEVCRELSRLAPRPGNPPVTMNVNLSRRQLLDSELVSDVKRALDENGAAGKQVNLEITESAIIKDSDALRRLRDLKALGVGIHMDDFGTGYSSLSCLHRFPLDVVKIDRSFAATLSEDAQYAAVVQAIVTLAHNLGLKVTVEGIETKTQLDQILPLGCDFAQGYFFSKPVDIETAGRLLVSGNTQRTTEGVAV